MTDTERRGFALLAALWLLVAISAVALELSLVSRERRLAAANTIELAQARAAADAGLDQARARLARALRQSRQLSGSVSPGQLLDPWAHVGRLFPDTVVLGDVSYRVGLRDAGAMLNLNRASEEELRRFFAALPVDFGRADAIAQSIMDWRDADDLHRGRGVEREDYLRNGSPVLPRNGPFATISELRYVKGVTPEIYERARPFLTLLGTGQVNLNAAGRPVLLALPGIGEEVVAVLMRHRRAASRVANLEQLSLELSAGARQAFVAALPFLLAHTTLETREVEVGSDGWTDGGPVHAHVDGLLVRGGGSVFLVWRRVI